MKLSFVAFGALAVATTMAMPNSAEARCRGCGVAAGVVGGVAAGAILGSMLAGPPAYGYEVPPPPPPRYYYEEYSDGPVCHVERRRVWVEGYGWRHRRIEVCD